MAGIPRAMWFSNSERVNAAGGSSRDYSNTGLRRGDTPVGSFDERSWI